MYVVVRRYTNAPQLFDALQEGQAELERLLRSVSSFVSYYLVRVGDGGFSVTVCENRIGVEETNLLAADWITEHAPAMHGNTPEVIEGETVIHVGT